MTDNHLTEENLQSFLLKETLDENISTHVSACALCRKKLVEYQYLIEDVKNIKVEPFHFDVTSLVMEKIIEIEEQKEKKTETELLLRMLIVLIVALFSMYPFLKPILNQIRSLSVVVTILTLVSALCIAIFLINDLLRQYRKKENLLFQ